jgi:hypothetical protein
MRTLLAAVFTSTATLTACSSSTVAPPPAPMGLNPVDAGSDGAPGDGSADDGNDCNHGPATTFACTPMPSGEGPCEGGPLKSDDAGAGQSFPIGCVASLPSCSSFYAGQVQTCSCKPLGMTAMWACGF